MVGGLLDRVPGCTRSVVDGDVLRLGQHTSIRVLHTPCHTRGHVVYHVTSIAQTDGVAAGGGVVFTGDTLFTAGAGLFLEGSAAEMHDNLNRRIAELPPQTVVYCGHEYGQANLEFAAWAEPTNTAIQHKLQWAREQRRQRLSTLGSTIEEEQRTNPFMRVHSALIRERTRAWQEMPYNEADGAEESEWCARVMFAVRQAKNKRAHLQNSA